MSREIIHSIILIITIALAFLFKQTNLSQYDLQVAAVLFLIWFGAKKYLIPKNPTSRLLESIIFTFIIVLLINSTGGVNSYLFFLSYFLLFSLALLLEPIISLTTSLTLIIFFILSLPSESEGLPPNQDLKVLFPILSLAFLTPFALFMGKEYLEAKKLEIRNWKLGNSLVKNKEDNFLFLSLLLKNHIKNIKNAVENFMGDHELSEIKKQAQRMEVMIEKFEKEQ